mmetsp:Transcript_47476/g.75500  ORF Transcript_47476/g.75500 Transcript_47476/m.75500 type:complete len:111 (+) Transcript_47476:658-990(+)
MPCGTTGGPRSGMAWLGAAGGVCERCAEPCVEGPTEEVGDLGECCSPARPAGTAIMEPPAMPLTSHGMPGGTLTAPHWLPTEGARASIKYWVLELLAGSERLIGCCIARG